MAKDLELSKVLDITEQETINKGEELKASPIVEKKNKVVKGIKVEYDKDGKILRSYPIYK